MKKITETQLKSILAKHKLWLDGKGGKCADLSVTNLGGADLYGAILTGANLTGAILTGANLTGAYLTGAYLTGAILWNANLTDANLKGVNLTGAYLTGANLTNAILPDISWIESGCLVQLNEIRLSFYLKKEDKHDNFIHDSLGFFIQNNGEEGTFDILVGDRIIRGIPDWVKYSGMKPVRV